MHWNYCSLTPSHWYCMCCINHCWYRCCNIGNVCTWLCYCPTSNLPSHISVSPVPADCPLWCTKVLESKNILTKYNDHVSLLEHVLSFYGWKPLQTSFPLILFYVPCYHGYRIHWEIIMFDNKQIHNDKQNLFRYNGYRAQVMMPRILPCYLLFPIISQFVAVINFLPLDLLL